jgi:hypothetical protein
MRRPGVRIPSAPQRRKAVPQGPLFVFRDAGFEEDRRDGSPQLRLFLQDITANLDAPESTLSTEAKLPIEPIENAEPTEPMDMKDPYDPIDRNELRE